MNTADEAYRDRRTRTKEGIRVKPRHSTELASSRSSKARIKIISTRFPVDFFEKSAPKPQLATSDQRQMDAPFKIQQITPKFSCKRAQPGDHGNGDDIRTRCPPQEANLAWSDPQDGRIHQRYRRREQSEQKICSFMKDVIQLTSSLKKIGTRGERSKKNSPQARGSIFTRQNIQLPPLIARNYPTLVANPEGRFFI